MRSPTRELPAEADRPATHGLELPAPAWPSPGAGRARPVFSSVLAGLGLAVLALGQYLFDERLQLQFEKLPQLQFLRQPMLQRQVPATVCLVVGGLIAALALRRFVPAEDTAADPPAAPTDRRRRRLAWLALAASVLISLVLIADILTTPFRASRPLVFVAALLAAGAGCALLGRPQAGRRARIGWADVAWIAGAFAFFVAANAPTLTDPQYSVAGDEYAFFQVAYTLASGTPVDIFPQNAVYGVHPSFSSFIQALTMRAFGLDHFGWTMGGVLAGALAVPPTYLTALWLFGRTSARVAAAVVASSHFFFAYAHSGYNNIDSVVPVTLTLCFLALALVRPSPLVWFLAGATAGFSLYVFFAARVAGLILTFGMLSRGWRRFREGLVPALFGCLLVVAPFVATNKLTTVTAMFGQGAPARSDVPLLQTLADTLLYTVWSVLVFHYTNARGQHFISLGFLDPISAALGLLGTFVALLGLRDWRLRLLTISYVLVLLISGGLNLHPHPTETRLLTAVPLLAILGGVAVHALQGWLQRLVPRLVTAPVALAAVGCLSLGLAAVNLQRFYVFTSAEMPLPFEAVMLKALFSRDCRGAGPVPIAVWGERAGLLALALESYYPTTYLPLIVRHEEYWKVPAYQSWPCVVVANPDDDATRRILADVQARDPGARLVTFTDGPVTRRVVAVVRDPAARGEDPSRLPDAGRWLYAVHRTSPLRGSTLGAFREPADLALGPGRRRFALDAADAVVTEFTAEGRPVRRFGGPGVLVAPIRLAVDDRGVLVLDEGGHQLVQFDLDGRLRARHEFRSLGLSLPRGLAIDRAGRVLVADEAQASLVAFDRDLTPIGRLIDPASEASARPFRPSDVAAGPDGSVYVYDPTGGQARRLERDGRAAGTWDVGVRTGRLGIAPDGSFWVGAPGGPLIRRFGRDGAKLTELGPGAFLGDGGEDARAIVVDAAGTIDVLWRSGRIVSYRLQD